MFAYCNNAPVQHEDKTGRVMNVNLMLTDSGGSPYSRPPIPTFDSEQSESFYEKYGKSDVEKYMEEYGIEGVITGTHGRYNGNYHAKTAGERLLTYCLKYGSELILEHILGEPFVFVQFVADAIAETQEPDLPSGDYDHYTFSVTSFYTDAGVTYLNSVYFDYYHSTSSMHLFTEVWRVPLDPSQAYYMP